MDLIARFAKILLEIFSLRVFRFVSADDYANPCKVIKITRSGLKLIVIAIVLVKLI